MELPPHFADFLAEIRLPEDLRSDCITAHHALSERIKNDAELGPKVVTTFLQGSYRRSTIVKPSGGGKPDVDVVVVTNLDPDMWTPSKAQDLFCDFLNEFDDYRGTYRRQGRSIGISLETVDLDLVITAAPSEVQTELLRSDAVASTYAVEGASDWILDPLWPAPNRRDSKAARVAFAQALKSGDWRTEPLLVPDRDAGRWEETDPLAQIEWTHRKNGDTNGHFVNVVKVIKWWWATMARHADTKIKGFLIERLVGLHCPDGINDVASGVTQTLEGIRDRYLQVASSGQRPFVEDIGIPGNNVFTRISGSDFAAFHRRVIGAASKCRDALNDTSEAGSAIRWREVFGDAFPPPATSRSVVSQGSPKPNHAVPVLTRPSHPAVPTRGRFA